MTRFEKHCVSTLDQKFFMKRGYVICFLKGQKEADLDLYIFKISFYTYLRGFRIEIKVLHAILQMK